MLKKCKLTTFSKLKTNEYFSFYDDFAISSPYLSQKLTDSTYSTIDVVNNQIQQKINIIYGSGNQTVIQYQKFNLFSLFRKMK